MGTDAVARRRTAADLDLRKLALLIELDRLGTVTAVAAALHMSPSAVSQQLSAFSRELGVPLTEQVGRRLRLTGPARTVLRHGEEVLERIELLYEELDAQRAADSGQVSMAGFATTLSALILPAAGLLHGRLPGVRTTLTEVDPPESFDRLARGELDVVIAVDSPREPWRDARFDTVPLMFEVFRVALPAQHPLVAAERLVLPDLAGEAWIFATVGMCQEIPLAACAAAGFTPRATHAIGDWDATFAAVRAGLGISLVPSLVPPALAAGAGVALRELDEPPSRRVFAAVRKDRGQVPRIAAALRALRESAAAADGQGPAGQSFAPA
jgi:DNA-binding transcriptional LysR family regulator